jgi:Ca-activated chloride channel homolog
MTFDPNDPRLTAYVLGELETAERADVEAMLNDSPECRQAVDEIRSTISWLTDQLREEQASHSVAPEANHRPIAAVLPQPAAPARPWWRRPRYRLGGLAALLLLAATISLISIKSSRQDEPKAQPQVTKATLGSTNLIVRSVRDRPAPAAKAPLRYGFTHSEATSEQIAGRRLMARRGGGGAAMGPRSAVRNGLGESEQLALASKDSRLAKSTPLSGAVDPQRGMTGMMGGMAGMGGRGRMENTAGMRGEGQNAAPGQSQQGQGQGQQGQGQASPSRTFAFGEQQSGQPAQAVAAAPDVSRLAAAPQAPSKPPQDNLAPAGNATNYQQLARNAELPVPALRAKENNQAQNSPAQFGQNAAQNDALRTDVVQYEPAPAGAAAAPAAALEERAKSPAVPPAAEPMPAPAAEVYTPIVDNPFQSVETEPQSTFSIDVDTASYSNVRRFLTQNMLPPVDAVRIEEFLNYFPYHDAPPPSSSEHPFAVHVEIAGCPWNAQHRLARIGIAARPIDQSRRAASNLIFLVDVSGSMNQPDKLPLVQWGLQRLVDQLGENDRVAIVVYASASGLVLPSTSCIHKAEILSAIEQLHAGGSTNGGAGIQLAYDVAARNFIKNGTNRVILATDGDLNVGITGDDELVRLIEAKAKSGVFLSVLGVGTGNIKDDKLEKLADKGNGHYAYIDSPREAYKVLVEEMGANLVTVAKDVKVQVDFNPARVSAYRLIGYEDRALPNEAFLDDAKDAGEIGAGHHVTAFYEIVPPGQQGNVAGATGIARKPAAGPGHGPESLTVKLRYKKPDEDKGRQVDQPAIDSGTEFARASDDLKFAAAVAGFGMMLRGSPFKGTLTYAGVLEIAQPALAQDSTGYRKEFVELVRKAQALAAQAVAPARDAP